jgi:hypothetical protein
MLGTETMSCRLALELESGLLAILDVQHFPLNRQWYVSPQPAHQPNPEQIRF